MAVYRLICVLCLMSSLAYGQSRYVVHFTDKNASPYSVAEPAAYLSARAIERRTNQGIELIETDLPVNPHYIAEVEALGAEYYYQSRWFNAILVQMEATLVPEVEALGFVSEVEYVAPDARLTRNGRSSADEEAEATDSVRNFIQNALLGVPALHRENLYGEGFLIAFMDSGFKGVNTSAAFSQVVDGGQIIDAFNFIDNNALVYDLDDHGTKSLSTVAATVDDEYQGIAPKSSFVLYLTEENRNKAGELSEYRVEEYNYLFAAERADSVGADIISVSLGYNTFDDAAMSYTYEDLDGATTVITRASEMAYSKGMLVVTSAGNTGNKSWKYITAPADGPNVIAVGSVDKNGLRSSFSAFGPSAAGIIKPDIMALGSSPVTIANAGYSTSSGTSFAAPQMAGLAALLWQREPELTNAELRSKILMAGDNAANPDNEYGHGVPNIAKLITSTVTEKHNVNLWPNPTSKSFYVQSEASISHVACFDLQGRLVFEEYQPGYLVQIVTELWKPGSYVIQLDTASGPVSIKLVKY